MKGLVFIPSGNEVQRFLYSGAFKAIQNMYSLAYVFPDPESRMGIKIDMSNLKLPMVKYIPFHEERFKKWIELFNVSCLVYEDKSSSFGIRFRMQVADLTKRQSLSIDWRHPSSIRKLVAVIKMNLLAKMKKRRFSQLERLAEPRKYRLYRDNIIFSLGLHPEIEQLFKSYNPDFIILPSSLLDSMTNDVLQIADHYKIPTFLLVSGWDNLSSKGIIFHQPTTIGVWGEQTRRHAIEIQGIPSENVFCIGAPHYEVFRMCQNQGRDEIRQKIGLPINKKVVLFGGSFRRFDETFFLRQVEEAIETGTLADTHILYRPHPWRLKRDEGNFFDYEWKHVMMDPEISNIYKETKISNKHITGNTFLFSMNYLNELYRTVDAVISPMSTLILEAMIFGKPVLAVAFNDGKHLWSADKTSQMAHFQELSSVPGVTFCRNSSEFIPLFRRLILSSSDLVLGESLRRSSGFYVLQSNSSSYSERLSRLVSERLR